MQKKLIVVADDFAGACDTGVQFRKSGLKVKVIINDQQLQKDLKHSDILVVDLESRFDTRDAAYGKCLNLGKQLHKQGNAIVYKKIDSTFRGNIGAEIDGLMEGLQVKVTFLAAALPAYGRSTEKGMVYVNDIKLEDTEVANDPRTPVKHSNITEIIGLQTKRRCSLITADMQAGSIGEIHEILSKKIDAGAEILIFDCRDDKDLEKISVIVNEFIDKSIMIAGTAGLATHMGKTSFSAHDRIGFVFSGSIRERNHHQLKHTIDDGHCCLCFIDGKALLEKENITDKMIGLVVSELNKGTRRFIFTTAISKEDVESVFAFSREKGLSNLQVAENIATGIGSLAGVLINTFHPSGVLLIGGDIAFKVVQSLAATGINVDQEFLPGIPIGTLTGCTIRSVIATKAGAFGNNDAITKTLEFLMV